MAKKKFNRMKDIRDIQIARKYYADRVVSFRYDGGKLRVGRVTDIELGLNNEPVLVIEITSEGLTGQTTRVIPNLINVVIIGH